MPCRDGVLHYSTRPNSGPGQILKGNDIDRDPPIQAQDPQLLGQIDHLEAGMLTGWACSKGQLLKPLEVRLLPVGSLAEKCFGNEECLLLALDDASSCTFDTETNIGIYIYACPAVK